jgi:hypothetical protein
VHRKDQAVTPAVLRQDRLNLARDRRNQFVKDGLVVGINPGKKFTTGQN